MRILLSCILILLLSQDLHSQVLPYAKEVVKTLSSEEFKGRGYVEDGDKIAADFIAGEFKKFGLKPFGENYLQEFQFHVNTFPGTTSLKLGEQSLDPGMDFLVLSGSPSVSGSFETVFLSNEEILDQQVLLEKLRSSVGKFVIVDTLNREAYSQEQLEIIDQVYGFLKYHPNNPASGSIFLSNEKLTWNGAQMQFPKPSFTVIADSISWDFESLEVQLTAKLEENYTTQNVIGHLEGEESDSLIVIMAHYDHFGKMGSALFPGANDNATGTAMMLSLARYFSENKPKYSVAFLAFGAEEIGLIGSKYFVENPLFDLSSIKFLLNFDLAGTGDEGIQVVNGSVYREEFDMLTNINEEQELLPQVKIRGAACNSDHCFFSEKGIPGFYIYTLGGIRAYHDVYDRYETLPFTEFEDYFTLMVEFIEGL